jgi:signal transduction histidine kinase
MHRYRTIDLHKHPGRCSLALLLALLTGCVPAPRVSVASLTAPGESAATVASGALDVRFHRREDNAIPLHSAPGTWWRITSKARIDGSQAPRLELSNVYLARARVWRRGSAEPAEYSTYGPGAELRYSMRGLTIPLTGGIAAGEPVYLRIEARGVAPLYVALETRAQSQRQDARHIRIRSTLLTVMIVTGVLALGFGLGLGEKSYFYFAAMVLCQIAYMVLIGGDVRPVFAGADTLDWNLQSVRVVGLLGTIAGIEFMRVYLDLQKRQPVVHRVLLACSTTLGLFAVASVATPATWTSIVGNVTLLASAAVLIFATAHGCLRSERAAWFALIAWIPAVVMAMLRAAQALGWLVGPLWFTYAFPASFAFAFLLLTLGLTERMVAIRRERQYALRESEQRTQQLATTGHDIRQPLLALRSMLSLLAGEGAVAPGVIERFKESIQYIDKLAGQYTAGPPADRLSRPHGGSGPAPEGSFPAPEVFPVELLLRNLDLMFRYEAEEKGLVLRVRSCNAIVVADAMATMRIATNLVANAVKYTQSGKVLIGCRRRRDTVAIIVADSGPGMSPEELRRVMKQWERGEHTADTEGSGLGLSIAQSLASERRYGFRVVSSPGRGTIFTVELPARGADSVSAVPASERETPIDEEL